MSDSSRITNTKRSVTRSLVWLGATERAGRALGAVDNRFNIPHRHCNVAAHHSAGMEVVSIQYTVYSIQYLFLSFCTPWSLHCPRRAASPTSYQPPRMRTHPIPIPYLVVYGYCILYAPYRDSRLPYMYMPNSSRSRVLSNIYCMLRRRTYTSLPLL